jgi:hypothetical protein
MRNFRRSKIAETEEDAGVAAINMETDRKKIEKA